MDEKINIDSQWTLITIVDPECLPGTSILKMIKLLLKSINFKFAIVDAIYGAGISNLEKKENELLLIDDLLDMLPEVEQFDWGDFFLYKEHPKSWVNTKNQSYPDVIIQSDTTIRAVDDQYIYLYTPYEGVVQHIQENYEIESIKVDLLENLDFPF